MAEEVKIPKFDRINMLRLNNDAHFQFNTQNSVLLTALRGRFQMDVYTLKEIDKYGEHLTVEDGALKKVTKSVLTEKIHDADRLRDETFRGLLELNKSQCKHFTQSTREAALRLQIVLDAYGDISRKAMQEQTSAVYNLCQELKSAKYLADATLVGLLPWIEELTNRNKAFDALINERYKEDLAKSGVGMREARAAVDETYRMIIKRIEALMLIQTPTPYLEYVKMHNLAVAKFDVKRPHNHTGNGSPQS